MLKLSMNLTKYKNKKILILGLGREGLDSLRFFLKHCPDCKLGVADMVESDKFNPQIKDLLAENRDIEIFSGENYLTAMENYDYIIKSPGIPFFLPKIEQAAAENKITSQSRIFFDNCPGKIIGVTGTKGKSTTASIIYEIIKKSGKKVFLLGNIGIPMLSYLDAGDKETFFVCELSAHQLYGLSKSPHIAVILNIYPEHLDYYRTYNEYIRAKANITIHQKENDYLIYNSANPETLQIADQSPAQKIAFNDYQWSFSGKTKLIGGFNLQNAKIGAIIGRLLMIPNKIINEAICEFKPLENRLEFVGKFNGIDCYNDSLSTVQESAVAAIEGLGSRVQTLVAGGFDRGQPFDKLAAVILHSNIKTLILFPSTGKKIWDEIEKQAKIELKKKCLSGLEHFFADDMSEAVELIFLKTEKGKIALLSAASASFGTFANYADRGRQYKKYLAELSSF